MSDSELAAGIEQVTLEGDGSQNPFVASLSEEVQEKVGEMRKLHEERIKLEEQFEEERKALLAKYQGLEEPLNASRRSIVVNQDKSAAIENFWLQVFLQCTFIRETMLVGEKDAEALGFLRDVRVSLKEDMRSFGFEFEFAENPFFDNEVLTKEYEIDEDGDPAGVEGCEISWKGGKNLCVKIKKKKGKGKRPAQTKSEPCETFFNWFSPPSFPDEDEDDEMDEELEERLEQDIDQGMTLKDKVIPHAIMYFVGEAIDSDMEDDDEDDEESDEEDDDESDEGEQPRRRGGRNKGPKKLVGPPSGFPAADGPPAEQPECKQQ